MPIALLEYDKAYEKLMQKILRGFMIDDGLMGKVWRRSTKHFGNSRNVIDTKTVDLSGSNASASITYELIEIVEFDIGAHTSQLSAFASAYLTSAKLMMFGHLDQITDATGLVINADGKPLSIDMILDMQEAMEWTFDNDGKVSGNQMFIIHPDQKNHMENLIGNETDAQRLRREQIVQTKRAAWKSSRKFRRLKVSQCENLR